MIRTTPVSRFTLPEFTSAKKVKISLHSMPLEYFFSPKGKL